MNETSSRKSNIIVGAMLILIGVALTLDRSGIFQWNNQWTLWPFILLGIGLARFVGSPAGEPKQGLLFMALGGWLLLSDAGTISVEDSWPILVIVLGLIIALNGGPRRPRWHRPETPAAPAVPGIPGVAADALRHRRHQGNGALTGMAVVGIWIAVFVAFQVSGIRTFNASTSGDRVQLFSVFGRGEHTSRATDFEGADVTNAFGRSELDLRSATLAPGDTASVRVVSTFGAVIIRVPPTWTVDTGAVSAFGSVSDERIRPPDADPAAGTPPRIVLRGVVAFGRLTIRS